MTAAHHRFLGAVLVATFCSLGLLAGGRHLRSVAAQGQVGQPKSVIHVVIYKWKGNVSDAEKQKEIDSIKELTAKIPGIKNIWLKTQRNQLRDYDGVFAIEFASPEAAADYAENPLHAAWSKHWQELRATSLSVQATNP